MILGMGSAAARSRAPTIDTAREAAPSTLDDAIAVVPVLEAGSKTSEETRRRSYRDRSGS